MKSPRMLKHCPVTVVSVTNKSLYDKKFLIIRRPILGKEHRPLYQFEFSNRWEGAYRSIGA